MNGYVVHALRIMMHGEMYSMNHLTPLQRITAANNIKRMNRIHEYYQDNPGCTIEDAVSFIPETSALVQKYSLVRTECQRIIDEVITRSE